MPDRGRPRETGRKSFRSPLASPHGKLTADGPAARAAAQRYSRLSRTPPKLVIIDDVPQPLYFPGPTNRFGTAYNVAMNRWIWQHYREVGRFARWLYVLVASVPAASDGFEVP